MTSIDMEPDEKILRNGSNHHTDSIVPHPYHTHHHHHHHHHHHKTHHHHHHHSNGHHQHKSHHSNHKKHTTKPDGLKTVDVDEFFEHSQPDAVGVENKDPSEHQEETPHINFPIPVITPKCCDPLSSGLSKSLPSNIPGPFSSKRDVLSLEEHMDVSMVIEEEKKYSLTHLMMEDRNEIKGVRTQRRTVSMNEDIIQKNFKKPLEELHHMKTYKENSLTLTKQLPKLIIPKAIPPRTRRLSKSTCKSPESPRLSKEEEVAKTIDKYISSCNSNYEEVEKQINTTFSTLSLALNHRRKALIEEAKQIRDRKVKTLNEKKENYSSGSMSRSSTVTNISGLVSNGEKECDTPVNEMQPDHMADDIGIHEPWTSAANFSTFQDHPSSEHGDSSATNSSGNDEKSKNGINFGKDVYSSTSSPNKNFHLNGESTVHSKDTISSSSGYGTSSPEFNRSISNGFDSTYQNLLLMGEIEEGNMTFTHNNDTDMDFISNIGELKEDLSSPRFTSIKGLTDSDGIVGDKVEFEVHTYDKAGKPNCNSADKITIRIYDRYRNKIQAEEESNPSNIQRRSSFNDNCEENAATNVYHYSFVPLKPGKHEISVKLNDIHITNSPNDFLAYPRLDLTFTSPKESFEENEDHHFPISRNRSSSVSQGSTSDEVEDEEDEEEDECHPHSMNVSDSWVIQKDGKSSLLQSLCNHPSNIYANESVIGMCGWQVRITTACMHIKLNIGVKTRSGIPDLDEQFTCDFHLETFAQASSSLDRANHVSNHAHHRGAQRKSSIFTRLSWTFTLLMNDGVLRVTCHELDQDKSVEINLKGAFPLRPYCSMIHHHNDDAIPHICPRPQLTFL